MNVNKIPIIDFENHFYDESLIRTLASRSRMPFFRPEEDSIYWSEDIVMPQGSLLPQLLDMGEQRVRLMDEVGIDIAVLSSSAGPEQLDLEESVQVCRLSNDTLAELVSRYPSRFYGSAILPVCDIKAACDELERCVKKLGFVAWHTHSNYGDTAPDMEIYRPLFHKAVELGIYVYLHPELPQDDRMKGFGFTFAGPGHGFTVDTATTLMRMILTGLFDELPDLKVMLGHLAEGLPFLLERIDNRIKFIPNPAIRIQHDVSHYFKRNIWVTTSGNMSKEAFECTKNVLGIDRILFGSDYPFESAGDMMNFIKGLPLLKHEVRQLCFENAKNVIGTENPMENLVPMAG